MVENKPLLKDEEYESSEQDVEQPQKENVVIMNGRIVPISQVMEHMKFLVMLHKAHVKQVMNEQGLTKDEAEAIVQMREEKESEERAIRLLEILEKSELYKKDEE